MQLQGIVDVVVGFVSLQLLLNCLLLFLFVYCFIEKIFSLGLVEDQWKSLFAVGKPDL